METNLTKVEEKQRSLKKESAELKIEYLVLGEQLESRMIKQTEEEAVDPELKEQTVEAEAKLEVISEWSVKYLQQLESLLVPKKDRQRSHFQRRVRRPAN